MAQWLAAEFGLTGKDARVDDNRAFRDACRNGHLATAQWLVEEFKLTKEEVRAAGSRALGVVRAHGRQAMERWLAGKCKTAAPDEGGLCPDEG